MSSSPQGASALTDCAGVCIKVLAFVQALLPQANARFTYGRFATSKTNHCFVTQTKPHTWRDGNTDIPVCGILSNFAENIRVAHRLGARASTWASELDPDECIAVWKPNTA